MSNSSLSFSEIALRLLCAFVTGVFLGLEREVHGRPAGLRTTVLACVAAAMAMILSEYFALSHSATAASIIRSDPSRLAAGVLSGIGFLGAGTIFRSGSLVRGVTTAAVLWFSMSLSLTIWRTPAASPASTSALNERSFFRWHSFSPKRSKVSLEF